MTHCLPVAACVFHPNLTWITYLDWEEDRGKLSLPVRESFPLSSSQIYVKIQVRFRCISVQHSSSLISSIKKRIFCFFERFPLSATGFEHTITCFQPQRSTTWANEAWLSNDGILVDVLIWVSQFLLRPIPLHAQNFCAIILILVIGK